MPFLARASLSAVSRFSRLTPMKNILALRSPGTKLSIAQRHIHQTSHAPATSKRQLQRITKADGNRILAAQRLKRPLSPHLAIYKWQVTSVNSSLQRITGVVLSGGLYLFGISYLASSYFGWGLSSESLSAAMASLPWSGKAAVKFVIAWPLMFHTFNNLRHLAWDMGKGFAMKTVCQTGYLSAGMSIIVAAGVALWY
ncbi:hypothetical protein McanMca71_006718 [Microsporum canis]|uniref:Succinate dehydrogenase cytochrome b560 subunit n=1 Tax=Arthroderma otae (strain ATCC MYA-4605 / CBS 113480) TaxID=554155 RepID=C5FFV1_ARTOC|nr:succinate dehydrogenase cytochrome b560 subunit [Microsporum canis CBS 113480]EEQ29636.1 succinate dehydrogenase cytochrome b560 subunit [Microsporum canis CBS 113480]